MRVLAVAGAGVVGDLVDVRKKPVNLLHVSALELGAGRALQRWANGLLCQALRNWNTPMLSTLLLNLHTRPAARHDGRCHGRGPECLRQG